MTSMTRMILATAAALCLLSGVASAADGTETIYLSQSGTGTGASCASPRSTAWFNTASNWTSTRAVDGKIGPNYTVRLCGTITSHLTFQGDGTSGNYITVDGKGATMNANFAAGANKSYGTIQNVTWINDFGGEPFTCTSCDNFIFRNNRADNWHGGNFVLIAEDGANQQPHHITIANNYLRTSTGNYGDVQKDIIKCASCIDTIIEGNHLEMRIVGASPYAHAHNDVIQSFRKGGSSLGPPRDLTVRYNKIVMNVVTTENAHRSWCILENLGGTNYFYGNLFLGIRGADGANGCAIYNGQSGVVHHFVGNTVVAKGSASNNTLKLLNNGTSNIRDNIFYTGGNQGYALSMATVNRSNNLWFGTRAPACVAPNVAPEICGQDPKFTDYANNDFSLLSASPANNTGANLGAPYNTALAPGARWPEPNLVGRPASGNWVMGAFQIGERIPPPPGKLVAAYNFDEGSGTTVTDRSGAGNVGTLSGSTWNTTGKYGGSLTFDGVDDYVDFGDVNAAEGSTKLSVSYWVKPQTLTGG